MEFSNKEVRRQDRLMSERRAMELLASAEYGVLSMVADDGRPYAVPLSFAYDGKESVYVHCAPEGHKLDCVREHPDVTFLIVGHTHVLPDRFTTEYESVLIRGCAVIGLPEEERRNALRLILEKYSPEDMEIGLKYADKSFFRTEVMRIDILKMSAKAKYVLQK